MRLFEKGWKRETIKLQRLDNALPREGTPDATVHGREEQARPATGHRPKRGSLLIAWRTPSPRLGRTAQCPQVVLWRAHTAGARHTCLVTVKDHTQPPRLPCSTRH